MENKLLSRLFVVSGPSQLLFLGAALKNHLRNDRKSYFNLLLLRGDNISSTRKKITVKIAYSILNWEDIIWIDNQEYLDNNNRNSFLKSKIPKDIREIWLCMPFAPIELNLRLLFYYANVYFFDDGLGSCVRPISYLDYIKKPSFIKKSLALSYYKLKFWFSDLINLKINNLPSFGFKKEYLLFSTFIEKNKQNSKIVVVDWQYLKEIVSEITVDRENLLISPEKKKCLIIGQFFSSNDSTKRSDEQKKYTHVCEKMISLGYSVIWKEHPKNPDPFWDELKNDFGSNLYNLDDYYSFHWPIEVILNNFKIDLCVSCTSTSLITINRLFGAEILSFSPRLIPILKGSDREVAILLSKRLHKSELLY